MHGTTLVFDLDGTLVDTAPDLIGSTNHVLEHAGLPVASADVIRPWISYGARRMIVEGVASSGARLPDSDIDQLLERFLTYYADNIACFSRPFPGSVEALEACAAEGARLAVCTNKREELAKLLLRELELDRLFPVIAGRDTFPVSKPHPDHLLGTIRLAGGDRSRTIMIGDSDVDIATAKAAGVPVVAVTFGYTDRPIESLGADCLISDYGELIPALRATLSALDNASCDAAREAVERPQSAAP